MKFQARWRRFLTEGGNVFKGERVGAIPLEFIEPTLERYYEELGRLFPQQTAFFQTIEPLGSVGKKAKSGDIDLAIDVSELAPSRKIDDQMLQSWELDPQVWADTRARFAKRARNATDEELDLRAFLYELAKYIGENSQLIKTDLKKVTSGGMFSLFPQISDSGEQQEIGIQVDWMLGNKDWLRFAYFSDVPSEDQEMLKGLHRTQLIVALLGVKDYSFQHAKGVYRKGTKEKVVTSPQETLELIEKLYGTPISIEELRNFSSLYGWIEANLSDEDKVEVYRYYLKILDSTRGNKDPATGESCGHIPTELEDFWRQNQDTIPLSGKFLCKDQKARLMGDEMLEEAATPRIANLGNDDIIALIDLILSEESVLEVSEKIAGQNLSVKVENGQVYTKYKNQPEYREAYEPFKSIFAAHDGDGEYVFEMISPDNRPDYVNYLTDSTIFVDFSGRLTDEMAKKLSNESNTFMTKKQIRRNQFDVTPEQRQELVGLRSRAEQRLRKRDKQEIADRIKAIILSPNVQSVLGGGVEGLYVTGGSKNFKIPSPTYQNLQKLQVGIYAVLSGRTRIPKKEVRQRVIDGDQNDKIVQDLRRFLSFAQNDIPAGYRMFVSPEEAMNLLSKMDTPEGRKQVYVFLNKRIKKKGDWYTPEQLEEAKKWSRKYKSSINCSNPKGFSQKQYCKRQSRGGKYKS
tara:strand:+ start:1897 stop:3960 length:2064 start_codon:yes stop_codon:yes gene_type:complete